MLVTGQSKLPFEVLSDNGKQFTGGTSGHSRLRFCSSASACRQNGVNQRLTRPRSPTTTGKIERSHKTLRQELLHHAVRFESLAAAQDAIAAWVHAYNHQRPHQALNMATPASVFRPHAPAPTSPSPSPRARMRPRHRCGSR
ncbi:integrase core domain-containing protein [Actinomadura sp. NPDC048955]|uniref:integrase core domain-containing protein n=1 Tax=Actinomadura sp. NPDC048955 TaxID=3158228 RepID=UPI003409DEC9